jgi:hypothetical protein
MRLCTVSAMTGVLIFAAASVAGSGAAHRTVAGTSSDNLLVPPSQAEDAKAAERGKTALLTRSFTSAKWTPDAYDKAWMHWGPNVKVKPDNYAQAFQDRYGLHPAPYENPGLPMGLRQAAALKGKSTTIDCLVCHGGAIAGKSYIGLGNSSLDAQALFEELTLASGINQPFPFHLSRVRGTSEAGAMSVFLLSLRDANLNLVKKQLDLGPRDDLCERAPAWWHLRKKKTIYHTGDVDARSVRSLMQFTLSPVNPPAIFETEEATFRDIQAYLRTLTPPKYPGAIDHKVAGLGKEIFETRKLDGGYTCSACHGTYGEKWTYPSKIVPLAIIGTDDTRFNGFTKAWKDHYNDSWFAKENSGNGYKVMATKGYQAPPLDGIWATAPYFHNGSVPTVYHVLNSKTRPKIFTRSFKTDWDAYDPVKLGWKVQVLNQGPNPMSPAIEQRKVYDTTQPGRGNRGHTFGDTLTEEERRAVIEYLKTL